MTPKLTVSLGFRDEFSTGWNEAHGRAANYTFTNGVISTDPRVGSSIFTSNNAKFLPQPRIGVAWSPFGQKTVIRAGFGMYNDLQDALGYRTDQNAPFNPTYSIAALPVSSLPIDPAAAGARQRETGARRRAAQHGNAHADFLVPASATRAFAEHGADRRLCGFARLPRNDRLRWQRADSHHLSCVAVPGGLSHRARLPRLQHGFPGTSPLAGAPVPAGSYYIPVGTPKANPRRSPTPGPGFRWATARTTRCK